MLTRNLYPQLEKHLSNKLITVITGLRRVGKTTALKHLLEISKTKNKILLDLERVENRHIFNQNSYQHIQDSLLIEGVDITKASVIAIDEIQLVPNITSVMKYFYDTYPVKFIVTGSSSFYLKNHFTESLAGRKRIFEMYPLTFGEYLSFKKSKMDSSILKPFSKYNATLYSKLKKHYDDYVKWGGLPQVVTAGSADEKKAYLKDVINAYIELDIRLLSDFSASDDLYKLIRLLATRVGSKIDYSKLSSVMGINRHKLKDYLQLLEQTYFIQTVAPFTKSVDKEISLQRKVYFTDSGALTLFGGMSAGALFENVIAAQLRSYGTLNYYARKTGQEIDFILNENTAIEVKETPTSAHLSTLKARALQIGIKKSFIIGKHTHGDFEDYVWGGAIF